jgi:hypothetical protein
MSNPPNDTHRAQHHALRFAKKVDKDKTGGQWARRTRVAPRIFDIAKPKRPFDAAREEPIEELPSKRPGRFQPQTPKDKPPRNALERQ